MTPEAPKESKIPNMSDEELKKFVVDYLGGRIFTSADIHPGELSNVLGMIFMPISLGALSDLTEENRKSIGLLWEYLSKAGPMGINGYPIFTSVHLMRTEDWERAKAAIIREGEHLKEIQV